MATMMATMMGRTTMVMVMAMSSATVQTVRTTTCSNSCAVIEPLIVPDDVQLARVQMSIPLLGVTDADDADG
jgi:hypothetical protein